MGRRKMTTNEFVERATSVHGSLYDYSGSCFERSDKSIEIECPTHGTFTQIASNHLRGYGCKKCSIERQRKTTKQFIKEAQGIHGDRYDYSHTKYTNDVTKVLVECLEHGLFKTRPSKHISGTGCPKCANKNVTTEEFIAKCRVVHSDKYDYSKVNYRPGYTKVEIICPEHGSFFQVTYNHLSNKQGCPECKLELVKQNIGLYGNALFESHPESRDMIVWLYVLHCTSADEQFYKVGITKNIEQRCYSIPYKTEVLERVELPLFVAFKKEQEVKSNSVRYEPQQKFSGWTECFLSCNVLFPSPR